MILHPFILEKQFDAFSGKLIFVQFFRFVNKQHLTIINAKDWTNPIVKKEYKNSSNFFLYRCRLLKFTNQSDVRINKYFEQITLANLNNQQQ